MFALNTATGAQIAHRGNERFPQCSTFKVLAASALLARAMHDRSLLAQRIRYTQSELVSYSPITEKHVAAGMTVAELCAAALQYSDNTAGNLLIGLVGGLPAVTAYVQSLGDQQFRLDRWETALNSALPGDPRGNTTGATRVHAGVPADWRVGDNTGGGDHGTNNDVAVLWPPGRPPLVLALYMTQREKNAKPRNEVLAQATRLVVAALE